MILGEVRVVGIASNDSDLDTRRLKFLGSNRALPFEIR